MISITIRATSPTGTVLHYSEQGWAPNKADAKNYGNKDAALFAIVNEQPFKGMVRIGYFMEVVS